MPIHLSYKTQDNFETFNKHVYCASVWSVPDIFSAKQYTSYVSLTSLTPYVLTPGKSSLSP